MSWYRRTFAFRKRYDTSVGGYFWSCGRGRSWEKEESTNSPNLNSHQNLRQAIALSDPGPWHNRDRWWAPLEMSQQDSYPIDEWYPTHRIHERIKLSSTEGNRRMVRFPNTCEVQGGSHIEPAGEGDHRALHHTTEEYQQISESFR